MTTHTSACGSCGRIGIPVRSDRRIAIHRATCEAACEGGRILAEEQTRGAGVSPYELPVPGDVGRVGVTAGTSGRVVEFRVPAKGATDAGLREALRAIETARRVLLAELEQVRVLRIRRGSTPRT